MPRRPLEGQSEARGPGGRSIRSQIDKITQIVNFIASQIRIFYESKIIREIKYKFLL